MDIDELTIGQAKQLASLIGGSTGASKRLPITVGQKLFIWTITAHFTGEVTAVSEEEIALKDAAWIADDGRLTQAMEKGEFNEVELFPAGETITLNRATFLLVREIKTPLPRSQK